MIELEKELESAARVAIRASITAAAEATPELANCIIIGFWLGDESNGPADDASGLRVMLMAQPSSSGGYNPATGFEPIRSIALDVMCVSQPDNDSDKRIMRALYNATRGAFETAPTALVMPTGVAFGGMLINNGGAADIDELGQVTSFTIELKVSL